MLKRFYLLSFALAFLSLGVVAQPLIVSEDFQFTDACGDPPHIIHDNTSYWEFTFTSIVNANKPLSNHYIYRYITLDFYRVNTGVNTLEWSYAMPYSTVINSNNTFSFDTYDMPDLPTGDYEVHMHVMYSNGSGVPSGNMNMTVLENGIESCAQQDFSGDGQVECDLGRITCFSYQLCHDIALSTNKFGTGINLSITGGTGPYNITWYVEAWKTNALPGSGSGYYYYNTYSVPKRCGKWWYQVIVEDLATGCVMQTISVLNRPCYQTVKDKVGRQASTELQFDLFPNPVSNDLVRVNYELPSNTAQAQLLVHNLQGQVVKTIVLDPLSTEMKIKVEGLANGLYVASIVADGQRIGNERMVISR